MAPLIHPKGEEVIITLMLENVMSKRRILEIYLNVIEWGNGVFGAEAAARYYYGVPASPRWFPTRVSMI